MQNIFTMLFFKKYIYTAMSFFKKNLDIKADNYVNIGYIQ